ncbi:glutamine synthetase family protein [Patulibacter defluvii]|uniref:glutamine synthetase family protein n=1 Tax=Patulibacter defluvii TaxID=3095358 RepID=UPI002A75B506|nr:glutamine synthetase family protein [Patulibacter sp. DM4]
MSSARPEDGAAIGRLTADDLLSGDFDTVVLATVDIQGRLVGKRLSPRAFVDKVLTGIHLCTCTLAWDVDQALEGIELEYAGLHSGWHDYVVRPDVSTLRVAGWSERTAICLGDAVDDRGELVPVAPRTILRRQVEALTAAGLTASTSTELEFFLYRGSYAAARAADYRDLEPTTHRHADYTIQETEDLEYFFRPLRGVLEASGLPVEMSQGEWGLGQWEMNLTHGAPLAMADAHALFKLGVKTMASRAGLAASFMARPATETGIGSSCHVHVSLRDVDGTAIFHDGDDPEGISDAIRHAVGGVLERAPELMPWYAPTVNSYRRTASEDFAGRGATWGFDNRTVTCRVVAGEPAATRLEYRVPGADVNPYLALAAILASVRDGVQRRVDPGPATRGNGYERDVVPLPETLDLATVRWQQSRFVGEAFGPDVQRHYGTLARHECRSFNQSVTDWEKRRYFEAI